MSETRKTTRILLDEQTHRKVKGAAAEAGIRMDAALGEIVRFAISLCDPYLLIADHATALNDIPDVIEELLA